MIDPMIYFYRKFVSQCIIVEQRTRMRGVGESRENGAILWQFWEEGWLNLECASYNIAVLLHKKLCAYTCNVKVIITK